MRKKAKQMWRSVQNDKEQIVELGNENEISMGAKSELSHPWRDALNDSIKKILDNIIWPESINLEEKKWSIKEIKEQQQILHELNYKQDLDLENIHNIPQKIHKEAILIKFFNIVVGRKYYYLKKQSEYERNHTDYMFSPEYGFYSRMVAFIEYQLINFVKKNGTLKFAVSERLNYTYKDESLPMLFKDEKKFKKILKALIDNNYVEVDNKGGYFWVGNPKIMNHKFAQDAPGLQLVSFSMVIKPILTASKYNGAKMCRILNEFFNCSYSDAIFRGEHRNKAKKYMIHFKFVESIIVSNDF